MAEAKQQPLQDTPSIPYEAFARADWSPELVERCWKHWSVLEEATCWGVRCDDWPPRISAETVAVNYPKDLNILTTRADFLRAVKGLPARERWAFWLYYHEGMTQREVARELGCSQRWASELLAQARQRLQENLVGHF